MVVKIVYKKNPHSTGFVEWGFVFKIQGFLN